MKSAQEVIFNKNTTKTIHPKIFFNNISVIKAYSQKHLELHLDSKLSFEIHIKIVLTKVNKTIQGTVITICSGKSRWLSNKPKNVSYIGPNFCNDRVSITPYS